MANGRIKITDLPETTLAKDEDIFIIENDTTTQKISLGSLINYIKEHEEIVNYFISQSSIDSAGGLAPLDSNRKIPSDNLPFGSSENTVFDGALGKSLSDRLSSHLSDTDNPHVLTKAQIGLSEVDNTNDVSKPVSALQREAIDAVYTNSNASTDTKITELINGASPTLDTLGKISKAVTSLIGHVSSNATASSFGHVKLSDTYRSAVSEGAAANGMGASQKALAEAYSVLSHNLTDSLGGITFGMDANGNYGYIKAGADTVTPFKTNNSRELNLYGSANVTYIFLLDGADYSAYNMETAGGYLNSSRSILFRIPDLNSNISIFSTAPVIKTERRLAYCFRADGTIIQQENSTTWITVPIPANGLYTFTLKEISEQYPSLIHGDVVGFGLYQYATANMGNNTLNSTVTW